MSTKWGEHAVLRHDNLAIELWVHVSRLPMLHLDRDQWKHLFVMLNISSSYHYSHCHMSFHLHKTTSTLLECGGIFVLIGCSDAPYNISQSQGEKGNK